MTTEGTGTLYALVDPRDGAVRYVGQTTQSLGARLAGHLTRPSPRVGAWLEELQASDYEPDIIPLKSGVSAASLLAVERAEITRRLLDGAELLNESATAEARAVLLKRQLAARAARERDDWRRIAEIAREALGGPLPPGHLPVVAVPPASFAAHHEVVALSCQPEVPRQPGDDTWMSHSTHLRLARGRAREELWPAVRGAWGHLRGMTRESFEFQLRARVEGVLGEPWSSTEVMNQYLTLVPWGMIAVAPWAALAARAGMAIDGPEFITWVSDDPSVQEALQVLLVEGGDRFGPLDVMDDRRRDGIRPSVLLAVLTAAQCGFELPESMHHEARRLLLDLARDRQLTPAMANMLTELDPRAADSAYGPDLAAEIDAQLQLQAGTAKRVMAAMLGNSRGWHFGKLEDAVTRAEQSLPTVLAPDYRQWHYDLAPIIQSISANFVAVGLLPAPCVDEGAEAFLAETQALWTVWDRWRG